MYSKVQRRLATFLHTLTLLFRGVNRWPFATGFKLPSNPMPACDKEQSHRPPCAHRRMQRCMASLGWKYTYLGIATGF